MDEQQPWMPADEEVLRRAVDALRRDVDALPLADVQLIKARGVSRRRRALVVGVASVAAAVIAIGFVGFRTLGSDRAFDVAPAQTSTTPTNPHAPSQSGGPLPGSSDWMQALGITESVQIIAGEAVFPDCAIGTPGKQLSEARVEAVSTGLRAAQTVYRAGSPDAGNAAATAAVAQLVGCQQMTVKVVSDATWPKVFSSVNASSHNWYVLAHHGALTSLLTSIEPSVTPSHPLAEIQALARVAQHRLVQEEGGAGQPQVTSTPTTSAASVINEAMPVAGTLPVIPSSLFVAASTWSSPGLSASHATHAVTTDFEGSAQIFTCDADNRGTLGADAGRVGVVTVADQDSGTILGQQRVRLMGSPDAAAAEQQRLLSGVKACRAPNTVISADPANPGYFKIVEGLDPQQPLVSWVAVTINERTPDAVSTISLLGWPRLLDRTPRLLDGFFELSRIADLAASR